MRLIDIMAPTMVWADLGASTKVDILREMATLISAAVPELSADTVTQVLSEREDLGSTGIQDGIAIPHGKVAGLGKIVITCGRSLKGVPFDAHDGKPTHLFFVLLAPEFAAGAHLKALARLSRILKDSRFKDTLMSAPDARTMYEAIVREDNTI